MSYLFFATYFVKKSLYPCFRVLLIWLVFCKNYKKISELKEISDVVKFSKSFKKCFGTQDFDILVI